MMTSEDRINQAKDARARVELEAKLLAAMESLKRGEGHEMTKEDWERLKEKIRKMPPGTEER